MAGNGGNPNPKNQWKPGQSGNPKGRPKKGESLTDLLREYMENKPEDGELTYKDQFIKRCFKLAMSGNDSVIKLIWNYMEGKPKETVDTTVRHLTPQEALDLLDGREDDLDDRDAIQESSESEE